MKVDLIYFPFIVIKVFFYSPCNAWKGLYSRAGEPALSVIVLISRTLPFGLHVILTLLFNLTVLLSYRVIRVSLLKKFSCPVARHGHIT